MAAIFSLSHLMHPNIKSRDVQTEIDTHNIWISKLTELRDQYRQEEAAGTRKP